MRTIAQTAHYTLMIESSKNRVYWSPKGFWDKTVNAAELLDNWRNALKLVSPGFTILADATQVKTLLPEWAEIFKQIQELMVKSGLSASAEILSQDTITKMQADRVSKQSGMRKQNFASQADAEKWLDTL
jgi:hypothetical protein